MSPDTRFWANSGAVGWALSTKHGSLALVWTAIVHGKHVWARAKNGNLFSCPTKYSGLLLDQLRSFDSLDPLFFADDHCRLLSKELSLEKRVTVDDLFVKTCL